MPLLQKAYLGSTALFAEKPWFFDDDAVVRDADLSTQLTAAGSTHTKGAYEEIIASTSGQTTLLYVEVTAVATNNTSTAMLLDIATGSLGNETNIAENIAIGAASSSSPIYIYIPVSIAASTRISARVQGEIASDTALVSVICYDFGGATLLPTTVDVLGGNTSTSEGVSLNANNSWTEIVSSTSQDYIGFCVVPSATSTPLANETPAMQIGVGSAGNEVAFGQFYVQSSTSEAIWSRSLPAFFPKEVAAGSRICVRQDSTRTFFDATVIAIPKP